MNERSKVYVLTDERGVILRCEGGYTAGNIENIADWILIAEGTGDKYNLCQTHFFDAIRTEDGIPRYKLLDGVPVLRLPSEIDADRVPAHYEPSLEERINDLEIAICEIMDAI